MTREDVVLLDGLLERISGHVPDRGTSTSSARTEHLKRGTSCSASGDGKTHTMRYLLSRAPARPSCC